MSMAASFFEKASGCITGTILADDKSFVENVEGKDWIAGLFDGAEYYVKNFQPVPRPEMTPVIAGNTASGLPIPCVVECNGQSYEVRDGEFEYDTPLVGAYNVRVRAFPYKDFEGILTVAPAKETVTEEPESGANAGESAAETPASESNTEEAAADESTAQAE